MKKLITDLERMYAKEKELTKVRVDNVNWMTYYLDEGSGAKWVKEYPNSEYHGGGVCPIDNI